DRITGLGNLAGLTNTIQGLIDQKVVHRYTILYMSAYKFQLISRKYGYELGSQVMLQVSKKLQVFTFAQSKEQMIARLVNDNFVVIVHNSNLQAYLDYLSAMEVSFEYNAEMVKQKISFCVGIYKMKEDDKSVQLPIEYATAAYNLASQGGCSTIVYYDEKIHNQFLKEKDMEARMTDALHDGEFLVYYQPKIELSTNRIVGAEALVRWLSNGRILPPAEFIPIFEKNGFVCQIDFFVLESVCKNMRKWLDAGLDVVKISVNFSRMHLLNEQFTNKIVAMLKEYRIPARYIEVEFTESADWDDSALLSVVLEELKNNGIATAMDDFGTGYSSLSLLTNLSFDILKIDKSLLDEKNISERGRVVMNNIIHMVQDLDIDVIMEGVETLEQVEFLKEIHCNMAQGYLFDQPLPIEKFEERLDNGNYDRVFRS
ncbi:MAG TPA: GGDEF domain-containing phosphodiesterase, partial [Lachnospiraceae bacterium]|nr:GGDEF domain-containing phosphodiesterase [Lachnospiraceae bacterium]